MPKRLTRNALLVKFFAQAYPGVPRTNLMKFIYMTDLLAREYLGHAVSTFTYRRNKFGPYDPALDEAVAELVVAGHATEKIDSWTFGREEGAYKRVIDQNHPVAFDFDLGESAVLNYVVTNYLPMPFKEFLKEIVYETPPMKATPRMGAMLPMAAMNDCGTELVGFRLTEVLEAEQAGRRGEFIYLSNFVDELRSQAPA